MSLRLSHILTVAELQSPNSTSHKPSRFDNGRRSTCRSAANRDVNIDCICGRSTVHTCPMHTYECGSPYLNLGEGLEPN